MKPAQCWLSGSLAVDFRSCSYFFKAQYPHDKCLEQNTATILQSARQHRIICVQYKVERGQVVVLDVGYVSINPNMNVRNEIRGWRFLRCRSHSSSWRISHGFYGQIVARGYFSSSGCRLFIYLFIFCHHNASEQSWEESMTRSSLTHLWHAGSRSTSASPRRNTFLLPT